MKIKCVIIKVNCVIIMLEYKCLEDLQTSKFEMRSMKNENGNYNDNDNDNDIDKRNPH